MLYDNALLSRAYLDAYLLTKNEFCRRIAEETLDYVAREMTSTDIPDEMREVIEAIEEGRELNVKPV
jgi:uncharacterized protein YyaL (SSP411 family)